MRMSGSIPSSRRLPAPQSQVQVPSCVEFMKMFMDFQEMAPDSKATCGVSNVSNGAPDHLRPILNQTYMMLLERYGMTSAILDAFDDDMKAFAAVGGKQELKKIVYRVMDGEDVDPGSLTKEQVNYAKTTKVLMGNILYSDSWLEF